MRRLAGITLIAGSLLFFVGAVTPVNSRVFATDDPLLKLLYIEQDPAAWDLAMTLLGLGGLIAAIGLVPLARSVQQVTDRRLLGVIAYGAATLAIGGAVSWVIISSVRIAQSPFEVVFADASPWLFGTYRVFTRAAFISFGVVLLLSGYPRWLGWMLIVSGAIMFADLVALVLPPFVHYVVFLILGTALLILRPRPRPGSLSTARGGSPDPEACRGQKLRYALDLRIRSGRRRRASDSKEAREGECPPFDSPTLAAELPECGAVPCRT